MELYNKISMAQARNDLKYLRDMYGNPQDFCGSFCNTEKLNNILMGKTSIKETIINNILYYFSNGLECELAGCSSDKYPDINDKRVKRIIDRYYIELRSNERLV